MRQITIDFDKMTVSGLIDNKYAGYLGEHNATELVVTKPISLDGAKFSVAFMTNGEVVHSKFFDNSETIALPLWQQLTQDNTLYVQLEAYDVNGDYLGKSNVAKLNLGGSVHGVDVVADADNPDVYAEISLNTMFRETLEDNVNALDKLTVDDEGNLLFNGQPIKAEGVVEGTNPYVTMAQTVALLLEESGVTEVATETPEAASVTGSNFHFKLSSIDQGYTLLYVPTKDGVLTYSAPSLWEKVSIKVNTGGIYEFVYNDSTSQTTVEPYLGENVLEFFKNKILVGGAGSGLTEEQAENLALNTALREKLEDNADVLARFGVNYADTFPTFRVSGSGGYRTIALHDDVVSRDNSLRVEFDNKLSAVPKFDIVVVDSLPTENIDTSTIYLVPSSKNAIKSSFDYDEESVYNNGKGFKENVLFGALAEDVEQQGIYLTGFIPIAAGDTVSLENIGFDPENTDCSVFACLDPFDTSAKNGIDQLTRYWGAKFNDKNELISFNVPENIANRKYIRIQASYIGDDSAVYINREAGNHYTEYIYVNGEWECLGGQSVDVDLSEYYTKQEIDKKGYITADDLPEGGGFVITDDGEGNVTIK